MVFSHGDEKARPHPILLEKIEEAGYAPPHSLEGIDVHFEADDLFHYTLVFDSR
jgi:hypothetical protein